PTAVINSITKLSPARSWQCGYNVNMRLQAGMLKEPEKRKKIAALMDSYFSRGGQEMQINCVSSEELHKAQAHPEEYKDLVVRVAGFSEFFTRLSPDIQAELIGREEHSV
ncbi:MAG: formate C-acetyltransferase/glycerol dehydratase family glycyl radical enzyme, partial [Spirochaetales bacterium]|nr:formate C-acetyltransferase/glycerol dehydratase family glycyl radical enzyme [Spirochaetales bacterium]